MAIDMQTRYVLEIRQCKALVGDEYAVFIDGARVGPLRQTYQEAQEDLGNLLLTIESAHREREYDYSRR